jgi:hypothetical protein
MNRTGKRRLLKLAELLEKDAKNKKGLKFDLSTVLDPEDATKDYVPEASCGTVGCAVGLAAVSGAFKRAGLSCKYEWHISTLGPAMGYGSLNVTLHGNRMHYDKAAMYVFDIDVDTANWLFSPDFYSGAVHGAEGERRVAKRIRNLVKGKADIYDTYA